ncbi:MAG: tRNA (N(6)-L-threonylcarbamoyladenosine(37)-C(2))-methylthiotransferase [Thermoplasmatota archaeon]
MKFYAEAYGCTMNRGETEMLAESWQREGHERVDRLEDADRALIGTCVVIRKTEERMKRRIKELDDICDDVVVTGCITKARKEELEKICPDCGIIEPDKIEISSYLDHMKRIDQDITGMIPIATGCTGNCHYCITKIARGELKSRSIDDITKRFESLLTNGYKEIQITCQDTASYGRDIGVSLPDMLERLSVFEGDHRIRVGMMNPDTAIEDLDEIIDSYDNENIYKFLHLPLQSGSDRVLKNMNRRYSVEGWRSVVKAFRDRFPDMTISTDVILGYPGETEEDYKLTKSIIEKMKPDILNITRFSARPGTKAYDMNEKVHSREKKKRSKEISAVHRKISYEKNRQHVGEDLETLILERGKDDTMKGRTNDYKMVVIRNASCGDIGSWRTVNIDAHGEVYIKGDIV